MQCFIVGLFSGLDCNRALRRNKHVICLMDVFKWNAIQTYYQITLVYLGQRRPAIKKNRRITCLAYQSTMLINLHGECYNSKQVLKLCADCPEFVCY